MSLRDALFKRRAAKAESTIHAYRRLFSTEDGQTVLQDLMRSCYFTRSTLGRDAHETFHNEGARSVVLRIFQTSNMSAKEIEKLHLQLNQEDKEVFDV